MKKLIVILAVLIAFVGAAFAITGEQLQINATVLPVAPTFSLYGGTSEDAITTQGSTDSSNPSIIAFSQDDYDLSEDNITVYIRLYQSNKSKYDKTATLTITATPLVNQTVQTGTYQTEAPTAADISKTESPAGITYTTDPAASTVNGNTVVTYAPKYDGRSIQATNIGTFNLTWNHNENLAAGSYKATITLGYTAP